MQIQVAAAYQTDADEVLVDFRSTEDDLVTPTVADELELTLLIESTDPVGLKTYHTISNVKTDAEMVRPAKNFEIKFRNPPRKMDLWLDASAKFGPTTVQKRIPVGIGLSPQVSMSLPDNVLYERDVFDFPLTGGATELPVENVIVLAPELQNLYHEYDFTQGAPIEEYEGLTYMGGGNRLLINNQTNQFTEQALDTSPWALSCFVFLEPSGQNLATNPFFKLGPDSGPPTGYTVDAAGAILQQEVEFDFQVTDAARIWSMRFIQNNAVSAFSQAEIKALATLPIAALATYTLSTYVQVRTLTRVTEVDDLILALRWYNGSTFVSETKVTLPTTDYRDLTLASLTATAPAGVTHVLPVVRLASIDSGDDVELLLLGLQVEAGGVATTRTNGTRDADEVIVMDYQAENQKVRFQMVPGFASGTIDRVLTSGDLILTFKASGDFEAEIVGQGTVSTPLPFAAGDFLDLTISHESGKNLSIFKEGQLLADTALPTFTSTPAPLTVLGIGAELLRLSVFSRSGA